MTPRMKESERTRIHQPCWQRLFSGATTMGMLGLILVSVVVVFTGCVIFHVESVPYLVSSYFLSYPKWYPAQPRSGQGLSNRKMQSKVHHPKERSQPDYSVIMQQLWELDTDGMISESMEISIQGKTNTTSKVDAAPAKLFKYVNETLLFGSATGKAFKDLVDNYNPEVGEAETITSKEKTEIDEFLRAVCDTAVMRAALKYLQDQGKSFPNMNSFQAHLKEVWFTLYPRSNNWSKAIDSSGFEHIFLGESKGKQQSIGGLHNWIGAYLLEQKGTLDYTGYISYTKLSQGRYVYAARLRAYNNYWKSPFSSFIFGSSPEFDLAAYTVCFAMRPNKECSFKLQNKQLALQTYRFLEANYISSAYPVVSY